VLKLLREIWWYQVVLKLLCEMRWYQVVLKLLCEICVKYGGELLWLTQKSWQRRLSCFR